MIEYKPFDYSNVVLKPRKGIVESRSECDTTVKLGKHTFKIPVVPANMESVIDEKLAMNLAKNGYFYIHHRFNVDNIAFVNKMKELNLISSISIGVNKDSYDLIDKLIELDLVPDFITIDIAHGHSIKMEKMIKYIKDKHIQSFLICGNICTTEAASDLVEWGADCLKIGIAPGEACTTYQNTGFGSRGHQASTVKMIDSYIRKNVSLDRDDVKIIADGGIRKNGDINIAIVMGADLVMVGGMLSAFEDSPGTLITQDGVRYKEFWGSASQYQSNKSSRIEGTKVLKLMKNKKLIDELVSIEESIQSAISYSGGSELSDLRKVDFYLI